MGRHNRLRIGLVTTTMMMRLDESQIQNEDTSRMKTEQATRALQIFL